MLRLAETHTQLAVVADQIGGPAPAADVVQAALTMARILGAKGGPSGIYHLSGAPDVCWADFAREIFFQAARAVKVADIPTADYPTAATRPLNSRLDRQSLERYFGIARPDWRMGRGYFATPTMAPIWRIYKHVLFAHHRGGGG